VPSKNLQKRRSTRTPGVTFRYKKDGSKTWSILVGSRWEKVAGGYEEAKAAKGRATDKTASGEQPARWGKRKLAEVGAEYLADAESGLKRGSEHRRQYEKEIEPAWGNRKLGSITAYDIITLDKKLRARGLSEATVANYLKPARGLFEYAVLNGGLTVSPFQLVPSGRLSSCNRTREHREWTSEEMQRLIDKRYELDAEPEWRIEHGLTLETMARTGARLGELLGQRYGDIDFEQNVWNVRGQWTKDGRYVEYLKTAKSARRIPLTPELRSKLAARKLRRGEGEDGYVHASYPHGKPITHKTFRRGWNAAVEAAQLDGGKVTPHDARHAFASEMADSGLSSSDLAEVMGHTTAGITERIYTHSFNRDEREQRIREAMSAAQGGQRG
jgi:integrase